MNIYERNVPTREELRVLTLQINFLGQIKSLWQDITEETERFNETLKQQEELLNDQRCFFEDLSSSISECEESFECLARRFTHGNRPQEDVEKVVKKTSKVDEEGH